jgi:hypothetical protein
MFTTAIAKLWRRESALGASRPRYCRPMTCRQTGSHWFIVLSVQNTV